MTQFHTTRWALLSLAVVGFACSGSQTPGADSDADLGGSGGVPNSTNSTGGSASDGGNSASGGSSSSGSGGNESNPGAESSGCDATSHPTRGQQTLDVNGTQRSFYLIPPTTDEPVPLVISFHGYGSNGQATINDFQLETTTGGKAVLLFPDGVPSYFQNAIGWDDRNNDNPDMDFVRALIDDARQKHCVDAERTYVVGFSWGGWMANQVTCAFPDEVRAGIAVAGGGPRGDCNPTSMMIVHGTSDERENVSSGRASVANWRATNGCAETSTASSISACVSYDGCTKPVWWCEHSGGHEVPGAIIPGYWDFLQNAP